MDGYGYYSIMDRCKSDDSVTEPCGKGDGPRRGDVLAVVQTSYYVFYSEIKFGSTDGCRLCFPAVGRRF